MFFTTFDKFVTDNIILFLLNFNDFRLQNGIYMILIFLLILPVYKSNIVYAS